MIELYEIFKFFALSLNGWKDIAKKTWPPFEIITINYHLYECKKQLLSLTYLEYELPIWFTVGVIFLVVTLLNLKMQTFRFTTHKNGIFFNF